MKNKNINRILFVLMLMFRSVPLQANEDMLLKARNLFYLSIEDKSKIDPAIELFTRLSEQKDIYQGRSMTYIGTLYTLKGKHAFLPFDKFKWVMKGLKIMDEGVHLNPDDIEALFIHGSTCYYLPFFFNRSDDAQQSLKRIVQLLPSKKEQFDRELVLNVIDFLETKINLSAEELNVLHQVKSELSVHEF